MHEIKQLDGLRGMAAIWVVCFHFLLYLNISKRISFGLFHPIILNGYFGLDVFFCLSGLIIFSKYHAGLNNKYNINLNYKKFIFRRIARIYPSYILALFIVVLFYLSDHLTLFVSNFGNYHLLTFVQSLLMVQSWFFGNSKWCWNLPAWSVSIEWFLYLIFPLVAITIKYQSSFLSRVFLVLLTLFILVLLINFNEQFFLMDAMKLGILRGFLEFFLGCLFASLVKSQKLAIHYDYIACILIILSFVLICKNEFSYALVALMFLPPMLILSKGFLKFFFASNALTFLGKISYTVYIFEFTFQIISNNLFPNGIPFANLGSMVIFFLHVGTLIAFSALVFNVYELPCRLALNNFFFKNKFRIKAARSFFSTTP